MKAKTAGMLFLIGLLLPLLLACSGASDYESEIEGWTASKFLSGDNSETWLGMMEDPNYPDISMPILYTPKPDNNDGIGSVDHSQASALGAYYYSFRKERGEPRKDAKFFHIQNGVFVIRQFARGDTAEPLTQEYISAFEESVCRISNEVFGGLPVTAIIYHVPEEIREAGTYKYTDLYVFLMEQMGKERKSPKEAKTAVWSEATCGEGIAENVAIESKSSEGGSTSDGDSTPKATSAPEVENYSGCKGLEDLIPKLAMPGTVALSYYQVVQLGMDSHCDRIIEEVNIPENLKN
jgi:hypothetical protein